MDLESTLLGIQKKLIHNQFTSEAAVSQGIVLPILNALGWNVFDTNSVVPEFPIDSGRIDFALCHQPAKPIILVEVKKVGKAENADEQLFKYAFHVGAPIVLLTDGRDWSFYFPSGSGNYTERRFYKLDLIEREVAESIYRLSRYLAFSGIQSGDYLRNAQNDYNGTLQTREIQVNLPIAFRKLAEERNTILINLMKEKVADLCGFQASEDIIADFMMQISLDIAFESANLKQRLTSPVKQERKIEVNNEISNVSTPPIPNGRFSISWRGNMITGRSAIDLLRKFLDHATTVDPNFAINFMKVRHGKARRYLDVSPEKVYPSRPDFAKTKTHQLKSGYFIGTNLSAATIKSVILLAMESNQQREGKGFILNFPR